MKGGSNRLLSAEEVADLLGVSVKTVYRNRTEWVLPSYRIGKAIKFRERDIEDWIKGRAE